MQVIVKVYINKHQELLVHFWCTKLCDSRKVIPRNISIGINAAMHLKMVQRRKKCWKSKSMDWRKVKSSSPDLLYNMF